MSSKETVSKNITQTFIVQIPNYILAIVAGIFLTRQLGPEGKGAYTLILTNIQLLVMFLGLNFPGAIQFFMANKRIEPERLRGICFWLLLISSTLVFIALFLFPSVGRNFLADNYDAYFFKVYFFITFVISSFNAIVIGFLQGNHRFREVNFLVVANSIINFLVFATMYYVSQMDIMRSGLKEVLILNLVILGINLLILFFFCRKNLDLKMTLRFTAADLKPVLKFVIPAYISVLVNFFNYRLTIWMVNYYEGTENLGYFSLAQGFAQLMLMVTIAINTVLFPYFAAKADWESAVKDFSFAFKVNMAVMLSGTLVLVLFSSYLIPLFYGEAFEPSVASVQILAVGMLFCSQSQVFGHFMGARDKNWVNTFIYLAALICLGIFGYFLIPLFGIEGASIASAASYFVMFIVFCVFVKLKYKLSLFSLFIITRSDVQRGKDILQRILKKKT